LPRSSERDLRFPPLIRLEKTAPFTLVTSENPTLLRTEMSKEELRA
jgi:hypothetical protein